jgi:hypothetical protein
MISSRSVAQQAFKSTKLQEGIRWCRSIMVTAAGHSKPATRRWGGELWRLQALHQLLSLLTQQPGKFMAKANARGIFEGAASSAGDVRVIIANFFGSMCKLWL